MDLKIRPTLTNDQLEVISILSKAFNTPKSLPLNEDYINTQNIYSSRSFQTETKGCV